MLTNFYSFPLVGVDVILGVSWLKTLGSVNFNRDTLSMELKYGGQKALVKEVPKLDLIKYQDAHCVFLFFFFMEVGL